MFVNKKSLNRIIYWVLIFAMVFANLAVLFNPGKAKATIFDLRADLIGFMITDNLEDQYKLPTATSTQWPSPSDPADNPVTIKWQISRAEFKDHLASIYLENGRRLEGFLAKTGNYGVFKCWLGVTAPNGLPADTPDVTSNCEKSGVTITESPNIHGPGGRTQADFANKTGKFTGGPDYVTYTVKDTGTKIKDWSGTPWIGFQAFGDYIYSERDEDSNGESYTTYSDPSKKQMVIDDQGLGPAFLEANIEAYIQYKLKPYPNGVFDSSYPANLKLATQTDIDQFKIFMTAFKNDDNGWARKVYKKVRDPSQDPFEFMVATDSSGKRQSLLTQAEITAAQQIYYQKYMSDYKNIAAQGEGAIYALYQDKLHEITLKFDTLMTDLDNTSGDTCAKLHQQYQENKEKIALLRPVSFCLGAAIGLVVPGGPVTTVLGAAGGLALGDYLAKIYANGDINDADQKIIDLAKEYTKTMYRLTYLQYADAEIGLTEFQARPNSSGQMVGLNPVKMQMIRTRLERWKTNWEKCLSDLLSDINALEKIAGDSCGVIIDNKSGISASWYLAQALCAILQLIAQIAEFLKEALFMSVYNAYHPPPIHLAQAKTTIQGIALSLTSGFQISHAHAQDQALSPLINALTPGLNKDWPWVITMWRFTLGLTNLFLVVILLFLGIVNIAHVQYDTYQLKKSLPLIILGVILANFSLLIMRMLIDAANILTTSFMHSYTGGQPSNLVTDLINTVTISEGKGFIAGWATVGKLLLAVVFGIFAMAAFVILGFMFYMRYVAIVLLAIAAPLAFVAMAFPPAQSLFKQWWSWTAKMIFMKPISLFLLFLAWQVKKSPAGGDSLIAWIIITILTYVAIIIPWKLGGAVAAFWGGALGSVFGTKKGGWSRKPVDEWWQRRKDQFGALGKMAFLPLFRGAEYDRMKTETMKKTAEGKLKKAAGLKYPNQLAFWEGQANTAEATADQMAKDRLHEYQGGNLKLGFWLKLIGGGVKWEGGRPRLKKTAQDFAADNIDALSEQVLAQKDQEKIQGDLIGENLFKRGEEAKTAEDAVKAMSENGIGLTHVRRDEKGNLIETGEEDENGQPKLMTPFEALNLAEKLNHDAYVTKDPEEKRNLAKSSQILKDRAQKLMTENQVYNGKRVNWDAFLDKGRRGRIFSYVTPQVMDDVGTASEQMTLEAFEKMLSDTGFSDRFYAANPEQFFKFLFKQYKGLATNPKRESLMMQGTTLRLLTSTGDDIPRYLYRFQKALGGNEVRGIEAASNLDEEHKIADGAIAAAAVGVEEGTDEGSTFQFLAEQVFKAKQHNTDVSNLEIATPAGRTEREQFEDTRKKLAAKLGITLDSTEENPEIKFAGAIKWFVQHPEILERVDLKSIAGIGRNYSPSFIRGLITTYKNTSLLGGVGGNPAKQVFETENGNAGTIIDEIRNQDPRRRVKEEDEEDGPGGLATAQEQRRTTVAAEEAAAQSTQQRVEILKQTPVETVSHYSPSQATTFLTEHNSEIGDLRRQESELLSRIRVGGQAVSGLDFEDIIAEAIRNSVATSMRDLQTELRQQFQNIEIDIPEIDTPEITASFKAQAGGVGQGLRAAKEAARIQEAQEIYAYTPMRPNQSIESIDASMAEVKATFNELSSVVESLGRAGKSLAGVPEALTSHCLETLKKQGNITPLTEKALASDPIKINELLSKYLISLQSARDARASGQALTEQVMLQSINRNLKKMEQRIGATGAPQINVNVKAEPTAPPYTGPPGGETFQPPEEDEVK